MNPKPDCKHEVDYETIKHSAKHGRVAKCKLCGVTLLVRRFVEPKRERPKMTKKERRRQRREATDD